MRIRLSWPGGHIDGILNDSASAKAVYNALPIESRANTWGQEVYFDLPANVTLETGATDVVDPGTICYWVQGKSLALPYGPTPVSEGDECRLVTAVNQLGKLEGDPHQLAAVKNGAPIRVEAID